jgi:carbon-monoxide dehydrogenase catalytic subunit
MTETTEKKEIKKIEKVKKVADPIAATIDPASQQMIRRAQELGIDTIFDRAYHETL